MGVHTLRNNFTAGELTPYLDAASNYESYERGARVMENMLPLPYGGVRNRPGTSFIAAAKFGNKDARLIPFQFSVTTRFVLEFGDLYIRFYSNGAQVLSLGIPYEIASPYLEADLFAIQFKQINDVMYLVHPSYEPRKLVRLADTNWTLSTIDWTYPALREENTTSTTLSIAATTGSNITLTASSALFASTHVGAYWEIRHLRPASGVEIGIEVTSGTVTSSTIKLQGDWNIVTTERWYGTLEVQRSRDGGTTWETVRLFKSKADRNVSATGTEDETVLMRLFFTATGDPYGTGPWVGTAPTSYVKATAKLESQEAFFTGLVKVVTFTDTTHVQVDVIDEVGDTAATNVWSEGAWSNNRGWPRAVGLFEQRLLFGGNTEKPIRFWGSRTADFENFKYGDEDDAALAFDIAATESNPIQWIEGKDVAIIGTSGGEFVAASGDRVEPLTPSNLSVRGQSAYGSEHRQPLAVNDVVIFLQRQALKLREMSYDAVNEGYVAPDLNLLAEHITLSGLKQISFCRQPEPLILGVRNDGTMVIMTYNREQKVTAWGRWTTVGGVNGSFRSVASIYGANATSDEIWVITQRIFPGVGTFRYVERILQAQDDAITGIYLDCSVNPTTVTPVTPTSWTLSGLSHLNAAVVTVLSGRANVGSYTVAGGSVTIVEAPIATAGTGTLVGLSYTSTVQPMKLEIPLPTGSSKGRIRRIISITLSFFKTLGTKFGPSTAELDDVEFRGIDDIMDSAPPLFTGDKKVEFQSGHDKGADFVVVQDQPFPMTLLAATVNWDIFGDQ